MKTFCQRKTGSRVIVQAVAFGVEARLVSRAPAHSAIIQSPLSPPMKPIYGSSALFVSPFSLMGYFFRKSADWNDTQ